MSSSLHSTGNTFEVEDETNKWDQMYFSSEKEQVKSMENIGMEGDVITSQTTSGGVAVITFDLDNTLWRTGEVIGHANKMLAEYLTLNGITQDKRTENIMRDLFNNDPIRYNPSHATNANASDNDSSNEKTNQTKSSSNPVFLSKLRTDAIIKICMDESNGYNETYAKSFAKSAFDVWYDARHDAIPNHYANNVLPVLNKLRSSDSNLIIGAITDGNSEPRNVKELSHIFDFVINAENVGVSKPHRDIYYAAIEYVSKLPQVSNRFSPLSQNIEDCVGPWWVHIGDDFIKDIVACKQFNMRSIWSKELIINKESSSSSTTQSSSSQLDNKITKDLQGFMQEMNGKDVVQMQIGADDYLADSITSEFVDATIDAFEDLAHLIESWQQQSRSSNTNAIAVDDLDSALEVIYPDEIIENDVEESPSVNPIVQKNVFKEILDVPVMKKEIFSENKSKFCIFCGSKLPFVAKFCQSCGEKQPEIPS